MVTYTLSFTTSFSMNYTGNFCLTLSPVLLGMVFLVEANLEQLSAGRDLLPQCSTRRSGVARCVDIPAAATTDVCMEDGCGFALCSKHHVAEQNPTPLNQAALVSHI